MTADLRRGEAWGWCLMLRGWRSADSLERVDFAAAVREINAINNIDDVDVFWMQINANQLLKLQI